MPAKGTSSATSSCVADKAPYSFCGECPVRFSATRDLALEESGPIESDFPESFSRSSTMLVGRSVDSSSVGVDFILPEMPWAESALQRAQKNKIDFGFGKLPCLTVEDIIIAKLYSLSIRSDRFSDLDDLQQIFKQNSEINLTYLSDRMTIHRLSIPKALKEVAPKELLKVSKVIRRGKHKPLNK